MPCDGVLKPHLGGDVAGLENLTEQRDVERAVLTLYGIGSGHVHQEEQVVPLGRGDRALPEREGRFEVGAWGRRRHHGHEGEPGVVEVGGVQLHRSLHERDGEWEIGDRGHVRLTGVDEGTPGVASEEQTGNILLWVVELLLEPRLEGLEARREGLVEALVFQRDQVLG